MVDAIVPLLLLFYLLNIEIIFRSATEEMQIKLSARIVQKVDHPNLLLDSEVEWTRPPIFTPRLNGIPPGWEQFRFGDRQAVRALQIPELPICQGQHLLILATGSYLIERGQVALTALREFELKPDRASGNTGSLSNYNQLASQCPQTTRVMYSYQESRPHGYNEDVHGIWSGPLLILKCQFPSTHKAQERRNMHTVTLAISTVDIPVNPLNLTGPLTRLVAYHCDCKSGCGTNRACVHLMGMVIGLIAPECFKSVKKKTGRLTDVQLPAAHQPSMTGESCVGWYQFMFFFMLSDGCSLILAK